jgi:hypothetical protein
MNVTFFGRQELFQNDISVGRTVRNRAEALAGDYQLLASSAIHSSAGTHHFDATCRRNDGK